MPYTGQPTDHAGEFLADLGGDRLSGEQDLLVVTCNRDIALLSDLRVVMQELQTFQIDVLILNHAACCTSVMDNRHTCGRTTNHRCRASCQDGYNKGQKQKSEIVLGH